MALTAGARLGPYEIVAAIGAGGMGEVFRARDTKLNRDVAIKIIPDAFAADPDRLARFEREAQLLASLNHPGIAQIYGLETREQGADAARVPLSVIVMELVDGQDLAQRLARGPMLIDDALAVARQLADALEAAHEHGVVHRDLKPANIIVKHDGVVKVLDFGLAKALSPASRSSGAGLSVSPTLTSPAQVTQAGVVLGTAAYMAPEQAKGQTVDKRADIWAFGCVLFEMLTGRSPFRADTVTETLASVMRDQPPLDALPASTPPRVRRLIARCLERDPRQRLRDIGDARIELTAGDGDRVGGPGHPPRPSRTLGVAVAAGVLGAVLAGALAWRMKPAPPAPVRRVDLALDARTAELSPDGMRIAYASRDRLFVRELASPDAREVGGAVQERAVERGPLILFRWSPDSTTIFTISGDGKIRAVPAAGGTPLVVSEIPETRQAIGLGWMDGDLLIAVWRGGLYRVSSRGGTPTLWLAIDPKTEVDFHALGVLPDKRAVFATHRQDNEYRIETFDGRTRAALMPPMWSGNFWYASSGHLLFTRNDPNRGLWAIPYTRGPLDPNDAVLVAPDATSASVAADGTLLVRTGSDPSGTFQLVARDRSGVATPIGSASGNISGPAVSPDGRRVAMMRTDAGQRQIWVQDVNGPSGTRLTFDDQDYAHPGWFPTGERIVYSEHVSLVSASQVSSLTVDGSGRRQPLATGHRGVVSPDGRDLVYVFDERGSDRLRRARLDAAAAAPATGERIFRSDPEPDIRAFALSPDGRMLAYVTYNGGRADLLLTRYPSGEGRWQVVANAGRAMGAIDDGLQWACGTGELFFFSWGRDPDGGRLMAVSIRSDDRGVTIGQPVPLFEIDADTLAGGFDVSADGRTIYMRRRVSDEKSSGPRFTLIQNWLAAVSDQNRRTR